MALPRSPSHLIVGGPNKINKSEIPNSKQLQRRNPEIKNVIPAKAGIQGK